MKDELSFPAFTHDSIAGYCNSNPLYAQYKNDKKSKYIGTKQMWQELSKLRWDLEFARRALEYYANSRFGKKQDDGTYALEIDKGCGVTVVYTYDPRLAKHTLEQIEHKE